MDNLCKTCANYSKKYDLFRQQYYDAVKVDETKEKHGCVMYDSHIPQKIWYENAQCPYYVKREDAEDGNGM